MNFGMLARAEHRGLGTLSLEWYRHMKPDRTMVVVPEGVRHAHLTSHLDWYPDATVVGYDRRGLPEAVCREWLDGLDVVYAAETFYDWRFCRWAVEQRCATVCHLMPEWLTPARACEPTAWWNPTSLRLNTTPADAKHVPVPIATDRFTPYERDHGYFRWLHIAGARTHEDRNGTGALLDAARLLEGDQHVIVRSQSPLRSTVSAVVVAENPDVENYWQMYDQADALVMPRRYAGLCLPVLEAFGKGLPVVMTDLEPQRTDWPVKTVTTRPGTTFSLQGNKVPTGDVEPRDLADTMNRWATSPTVVEMWAKAARDYAHVNSWTNRAPEIRRELEQVADRIAA